MKFILEIKLGNDAMQSYADIRKAIGESFSSIMPFNEENDTRPEADETGLIRDLNGNSVGKWEVVDAD